MFPSVGFISKHIMSFLFPAIAVRGLHCHKYTLPVPTRCQQEKQKAPPHSSPPSCANKDAGIYSCRVSAWTWVGKRKMQKKKKKKEKKKASQISSMNIPHYGSCVRSRTTSFVEHRHSQNIVTPRTSLPEHRHSQHPLKRIEFEVPVVPSLLYLSISTIQHAATEQRCLLTYCIPTALPVNLLHSHSAVC